VVGTRERELVSGHVGINDGADDSGKWHGDVAECVVMPTLLRVATALKTTASWNVPVIGQLTFGGSPTQFVAPQAGIVDFVAAHMEFLSAFGNKPTKRIPHQEIIASQIAKCGVGSIELEHDAGAEMQKDGRADDFTPVAGEKKGAEVVFEKVSPDV